MYSYGSGADSRSSSTFRDLGDCNTLSFNKCVATAADCGIRIYGMPTNESDFDSTKELIWKKDAPYTWTNKSFDISSYEKITVILIPGDGGTITISGFKIE